MFKKIVAVLSCLLLAAPMPAIAHPYQHDEDAIVQVVCVMDDGIGFGTAVKIGPDEYVTAKHVATLGKCSVDGQPVVNTYVDPKLDIATFRGPKNKHRIRVSCAGYTPGEVYIARGYAEGGPEDAELPWLATSLKILGMTTFVGDAFHGMSGGPLIGENGRVYGVVDIGNPAGSVALRDSKVCR